MTIPKEVHVSFWLQLVALVPGVVAFLPTLVTPNSTPGFIVFGAVFYLGVLALWGWIAVRTRQGRAVFRTVLTVTTGIWGAAMVYDIATRLTPIPWLTTATFAVSVVAVILLWLPASRRYFDAVSELRAREPRR